MKKIVIYSLTFIIIVLLGLGLSFWSAKKNADDIRMKFDGEVSNLKGRLVLFQGDDFSPCWVFRGEYIHMITGATFDVYVSLLGNVLKEPTR